MLTPIIREDLLYYIWKTKSFDMANLKTTDGQSIEILQFGTHNFDSGPDFSNGTIKINQTVWVGNVEMHVYSSDWERHCHDLDKAYDNVILHVVYEHDKEVYTTTEQYIPCLELKDRIPKAILGRYSKLIANNFWIPCEKHISKIEAYTISFWLQRLAAERLEEKTKYLKQIFLKTNSDWEETLYICLARYMGARVNMEPFEMLAKATPFRLIQKNRDDIGKVEALLFGQAGMLQANHEDAYFMDMKKEYTFLQLKYKLKPISITSWKFSRMRPIGFPTIRISHFAQILHRIDRIFSQLILEEDIQEIKKILKVEPSTYWNQHYTFGKRSTTKKKQIGEAFIDQLIINVICPITFLYGKQMAEEKYCEKAIRHFEALKPEKNAIISKFKMLEVPCESALESQALIQMKKEYCDRKQCATCAIGNAIMKRKE